MTARGSDTHDEAGRRAEPMLVERLHAAALRRVHGMAEGALRLVGGHDGTGGKHELDTLTIGSANKSAGVHFVSTPWAVLDWVHACLAPDAEKPSWTFLDLGAGKGRAVLSAARKPYGRVIGVEFAAELAAAARRNVRLAGHAEPRVAIVEGDAATTPLPDGPLAVFLFNPFGPPVFDDVIARLAAHRAAHGAPIRIAYLNPVHATRLTPAAGFRRRRLPKGMAAVFAFASPYRLALFEAL